MLALSEAEHIQILVWLDLVGHAADHSCHLFQGDTRE